METAEHNRLAKLAMGNFYDKIQDIIKNLEAVEEQSIILHELKDKTLGSSSITGNQAEREAAISFAKDKTSELIGAFILVQPVLYDAAKAYKSLKAKFGGTTGSDSRINSGFEIIYACVEEMWMRHLNLMRLLTQEIYR